MHRIFVKSYFSAAHFLSDEPIHGHNYGINVILRGDLKNGMVEDFRVIQKHLEEFCKTLDHYLLIPGKNKDVTIEKKGEQLYVNAWGRAYVFPVSDIVILPIEDTTAELIAWFAYDKLKENLKAVSGVQIDENPNCTAEYVE